MKKYAKIIGLAGLLLAVCLLLAGCQQQDESYNTVSGAETTASRYATLPPENMPTVTPDMSWTPEENNGGQNGLTNDQPPVNGNPWDNTVTDPMASDQPMYPGESSSPFGTHPIETITIPPVTPSPTPGASPTPKSLQVGFKDSDEVREMQKKLKELGYYKGSADGDFGPATEKAVMAFQKANGLSADGKAGEKTLKKLYGSNSKSSKEAKATTAPKISKNTYLDSGKSGKDVKALQNRLIELGWLSGSASGKFDDATEAAVIAFQKKAKLWADGKAGPKTIEKLFSSSAPKSSKPANSSTLEKGSEGSEVKKMQQRLKDLGYLEESPDGKFGDATEAAVIKFQKNNGLTADGKAGTATLNKLYGDEARKWYGDSQYD